MAIIEIIGIGIMFVAVFFSIFQKDKLYDSKKGCYYISDVDKEFKFKLELSGRMPNESKERRIVVYTDDENLTFDDVMWLAFSDQSDGTANLYVEVKR